jgi:hypothetical protein
MRLGGLALAALALIATGCGVMPTANEAAPAIREPCVPPVGEEEGLDGTEAAHPVAIGPGGAVIGVKRELDGSALYISDSGVCSVAETAPGTWALTSLVLDEHDHPVPGAAVTLEALEPRSLHAVLVARADDDGAVAFVNVPFEGPATCYRTRVTAAGFLPYTDVARVTPEPVAGNIQLARDSYDSGLGMDRRACVDEGPATR